MRKTLNLNSWECIVLFNALKHWSTKLQDELKVLDKVSIEGNEDAMQFANFNAKQVNGAHTILKKLGL